MRFAWLFWWRPPFLYREVLVNLVGAPDSTIRGVLWGRRGAWLTFRNASVMKGTSETALDGEVTVPREQILFVQVLPAPVVMVPPA